MFELKSDEAIFMSYSYKSKAYRVFNLFSRVIKERIDINYDDKFIRNLEPTNVIIHIIESDANPWFACSD